MKTALKDTLAANGLILHERANGMCYFTSFAKKGIKIEMNNEEKDKFTEDDITRVCAICGTPSQGDASRYGETHSEFKCSRCTHTWLEDVSKEIKRS